MTSPAIRIGNLLYVWLHVHHRRVAGQDVRALWTVASEDWDDLWGLSDAGLVVHRAEMRVWDRREEMPVLHFQQFGVDFTADDVHRFAGEVLLRGRFAELVDAVADPDALVVSVRRGDYYADPELRARYGFDYEGYLHEAWRRSCERDGVPQRVVVVSDDEAWCRAHLGWLAGACEQVGFAHEDPVRDLARLAAARRLVLANSTFSYWGGYLSGVRHPGSEDSLVAPRFHVRDVNAGRAWQLDPRWQAVEGFS
jgi:hypothetical protein